MTKKIDPAGGGSWAAVGEGALGPVLVVDGGAPGSGPGRNGSERVPGRRGSSTHRGLVGVRRQRSAVSRVEFLLSPVASGTRVDLHHFDLPDTTLTGHGDGRGHFLPRLETDATRANPDRMTGGPSPRKHTSPSRTLNREELCP